MLLLPEFPLDSAYVLGGTPFERFGRGEGGGPFDGEGLKCEGFEVSLQCNISDGTRA
jgi:hypothetical protein